MFIFSPVSYVPFLSFHPVVFCVFFWGFVLIIGFVFCVRCLIRIFSSISMRGFKGAVGVHKNVESAGTAGWWIAGWFCCFILIGQDP